MTQDSVSDGDGIDQSENTGLEERITALEEHNRELEAQLEQQQSGGHSDMTRRGALGVLGGGALLGAAGSASAQQGRGRGGGAPFADEDHDHSGDYLGEGESVDSMDVTTLNRVHWLDPDADDWGAAVNAALEEMSDGDVLRVPPVRYNHSTKAVVDKEISIVGDADGKPFNSSSTRPAIVKQADVPILEGGNSSGDSDATQLRVEGLGLGSNVDDSTPGLIFHAKCVVSRITGRNLGGDMVLLQQEAGLYDNLNYSHVTEVSANQHGGSVVRIENQSDAARNVNAMYISVQDAGGVSGWAIDADEGFGNQYEVIHHGDYGDIPGGGAIRMNTQRSFGRIIYQEGGSETGIQFDDNTNTGEIIWSGLPYDRWFVDNGGNNSMINHGKPGSPRLKESYSGTTYGSGLELTGEASAQFSDGTARGTQNGWGIEPVDLSSTSGDFDGQMRPDDGTNTAGRGIICAWDAQNGVWRKPNGSTIAGGTDDNGQTTFEVPQQSINVDGDVSELSDTSRLSVADDFSKFRGDATVDGNVWFRWDDSNFYMVADLNDNTHTQEASVGNLYRGDSLQVGIAPDKPEGHDNAEDFTEFTFGLTADGPRIYRRNLHDGTSGSADAANLEIIRDESSAMTTYELALPWSALRADPSNTFLSLAATITDYDADEETGLLEWGGGILGGKNVRAFNRTELAGQ